MTDGALDAATLLALEQVAPATFRSTHNQDNRLGMIFGGQPLGQALAAAARTVAGWPAHHIAALFLRGGAVDAPVDYVVETLRDGRRYAARRVRAEQGGRAIFELLASFHDTEDGFEHQRVDMPAVPAPEDLLNLYEFAAAHDDRVSPALLVQTAWPFPVEIRLLDPAAALIGDAGDRNRDFWFRVPSAAGIADPPLRQALLAFASDYWFAGTAAAGHRGEGHPVIASLNHAMWFHAPADPGDWLLFRTESPWAGVGRGLARGLIHDRAGLLVASAVQEIRLMIPAPRR